MHQDHVLLREISKTAPETTFFLSDIICQEGKVLSSPFFFKKSPHYLV